LQHKHEVERMPPEKRLIQEEEEEEENPQELS
jgi:hypothetical protein